MGDGDGENEPEGGFYARPISGNAESRVTVTPGATATLVATYTVVLATAKIFSRSTVAYDNQRTGCRARAQSARAWAVPLIVRILRIVSKFASSRHSISSITPISEISVTSYCNQCMQHSHRGAPRGYSAIQIRRERQRQSSYGPGPLPPGLPEVLHAFSVILGEAASLVSKVCYYLNLL
jgi:hypothetical protein